MIAAARRPPKDPAKAAAEKKSAARKPSSWRLYQQLCDVSSASRLVRGRLREVVVDTGEKTSLGQTEEPSASKKSGLVLDAAHDGHDDTPGDDDGGEEDARRVALEQNCCSHGRPCRYPSRASPSSHFQCWFDPRKTRGTIARATGRATDRSSATGPYPRSVLESK
jgi:hypothetical protein